MKKGSSIIVMLILVSVVIASCGSRDFPDTEQMNNNATVVEQTDVYTNIGMSQKVGSFDAGVSVIVKKRVRSHLNLCMVVTDDLEGWVDCHVLEIEE